MVATFSQKNYSFSYAKCVRSRVYKDCRVNYRLFWATAIVNLCESLAAGIKISEKIFGLGFFKKQFLVCFVRVYAKCDTVLA